jgi:hypothetical protein
VRSRPLVALALTVAAGVALAGGSAVARRSRPEACPGGRFLVAPGDIPLIAGAGSPAPDAIVIGDENDISIGGCQAAQARLKPRRDFTRIRGARWQRCGVLTRVRLTAKILAPTCDTIEGRIKARGVPAKPFTATRSTCGDRVLDAENGETCDASAPAGDAACAGRCEPPGSPGACGCTPTTTTTTTSSTTTTSIPGCAGRTFDSTWAAIEELIFVRHACAFPTCHGSAFGEGGLDLRRGRAYANLVEVPSNGAPGTLRVKPGDPRESLLWLKLAKKTLGGEYLTVPGSGMPFGDVPALSRDEVEAVRLWIQAGASDHGVVPETADLLSACLPPPDPPKIDPPPPPPAGEGIQLAAPPWTILPRDPDTGQNGEDEVCHATYYDVSAQVPASARIPRTDPACQVWGGTRDCFYYNRTELTQDPNSHHSIIQLYRGQYDFDHPDYARYFGPFTCRAGARAGAPCDPRGGPEQCPGSACGGQPRSAVACILWGPPDFGFNASGSGTSNAPNIGGSQEPYFRQVYPLGVFGVLPVKGTVVWNSHAFNVTDRPTTNEQWYNIWFARTAEERQHPVRSIFDSRYIFVQSVPPFGEEEYCATYTAERGARVFELSSHTHKRGALFRIWAPPNAPCSPGPLCLPDDSRPPLVATTSYDDPIQYRFPTPLALDDAGAAARTFKYCSVYDNGFTDPAEVKRQSTSPPPPLFLAPGGPCSDAAVACLDGPRRGQPCGGDDRNCDTTPGADDGVCDACPLGGGVTTEDEMFIFLGTYYRAP